MNLYFRADFMVKKNVRCLDRGRIQVLAIGAIFRRFATEDNPWCPHLTEFNNSLRTNGHTFG